MELKTLENYLNTLLHINDIKDYCPNGLQVQASNMQIKKIVTGVTACEALIDYAIEVNADAILVHHGYFWKGDVPEITGVLGNRIRKLMCNDIHLLGYHLPLDLHPTYGNNALFANILAADTIEIFDNGLLYKGTFNTPITKQMFCERIETAYQRQLMFIEGKSKTTEVIKEVVWCTGAAYDYIQKAFNLGADLFISGEIAERTVHLARELNLHYAAVGHHASEIAGIKALGEHLAEKFDLDVLFKNIDNPV